LGKHVRVLRFHSEGSVWCDEQETKRSFLVVSPVYYSQKQQWRSVTKLCSELSFNKLNRNQPLIPDKVVQAKGNSKFFALV